VHRNLASCAGSFLASKKDSKNISAEATAKSQYTST
jgi:hypothetical protein